MLHDIIEARAMRERRLFVKFDDGTEGTIDITTVTRFDGMFAALRDQAIFARVRVDPELGTVVWPTGADLCPDVLYSRLTGAPLPGSVVKALAP